MHWGFKAALMGVFSALPGGDRLHYWTQRNITKSLPRSEREILEKFEHAKGHVDALARHGSTSVSESRFYEFGAGWDLAISFCFYTLGVKSQVLVDLFELARPDLANDAIGKIEGLAIGGSPRPIAGQRIPEEESTSWVPFLQERYGIRYMAPCDARSTALPAESVDCITSTDTLEHIPVQDIRLILQECRRILRKDGILSFVIDYHDHYFYCDRSITPYNFLRYSDETWRWFNPRYHFQNRLRHRDYIQLAQEQGFELVEEKSSPVSPKDLSDLEQTRIAARFKGDYRPEELAIRRGHLVFRPVLVWSP